MLDAFDEQWSVERVLGNQDDVRLPVRRAERDVAGVPAHHFDDGDAAVAFGGGPDALDALRGHQDGRGITRCGVVDDVIEIEGGTGRILLVDVSLLVSGILDAHPFVGLARVVQAQVVVDRLRCEDGRQALGQRLQGVERAVTADGNQPLDAQLGQACRNAIQLVLPVRIDVVPRRADESAALGRIELRDFLKQRVQMHVRHAWIEQAVEAFDEPVDLNPQLVGAHDGAVYRGVERRCITAGRQDADAFHGCCCCGSVGGVPHPCCRVTREQSPSHTDRLQDTILCVHAIE